MSWFTADGYWSHEIKGCLPLGRKIMTNLESILKSRDITLPAKVHLVKAVVFPIVMYGCGVGLDRKLSTKEWILLNCGVGEDFWESLRQEGDPTNRSKRKSVMNIHWNLESLMLKLKLHYFGHLMRRTDSLERTLILGKTEGRRRRRWQRMRWLDGITNSITWVWASSRSWWRPGKPGVLQFMGSQRVGHDWATELNNEEAGYSTVFPGYLNIGL